MLLFCWASLLAFVAFWSISVILFPIFFAYYWTLVMLVSVSLNLIDVESLKSLKSPFWTYLTKSSRILLTFVIYSTVLD